MKRMHALFPILFSVLLLGACSEQPKKAETAPETVRNVPLVEVQQKNMPDMLEAVGTTRAAQTSTLASQMMGTLVEVRVHEGDRVQRGLQSLTPRLPTPLAASNSPLPNPNSLLPSRP